MIYYRIEWISWIYPYGISMSFFQYLLGFLEKLKNPETPASKLHTCAKCLEELLKNKFYDYSFTSVDKLQCQFRAPYKSIELYNKRLEKINYQLKEHLIISRTEVGVELLLINLEEFLISEDKYYLPEPIFLKRWLNLALEFITLTQELEASSNISDKHNLRLLEFFIENVSVISQTFRTSFKV